MLCFSFSLCSLLVSRDGLEHYQELLFEYLYNMIDKKSLEDHKISDFTNQKSNTLNFFQAAGLLLFSLTNKKYDKYVLWALERLYVLSSDAKLSELLLWNLGCEYEKHEKFRIASELFYQFKRIFPGSDFYWNARVREIFSAYKFCLDEYHDINDVEKTIKLSQDYIVDVYELGEELNIDIVYILQDLSMRMIKKTVDIGLHYLKKNQYTYDLNCILSSLHRLEELLQDVKYFFNFNIDEIKNDSKYINYMASLLEIKKQVEGFFIIYEDVKLPSGANYPEEYEAILIYISENKKSLIDRLSSIYHKIDYCIEVYYEIL